MGVISGEEPEGASLCFLIVIKYTQQICKALTGKLLGWLAYLSLKSVPGISKKRKGASAYGVLHKAVLLIPRTVPSF